MKKAVTIRVAPEGILRERVRQEIPEGILRERDFCGQKGCNNSIAYGCNARLQPLLENSK